MVRRMLIVAPLLAFVLVVGCQKKAVILKKSIDFNAELPPGTLALRKLSPGEYPNFYMNRPTLANLVKACDHSISYMLKPSSKKFFPYEDITHDRAVASLYAFKEVLNTETRMPLEDGGKRLNQVIRDKFEVYKSIGAPNPEGGYTERVLFTGYCTPIYNASLTRTDVYKWPLHKRPSDLKTDADGKVIGEKYATRKEIESKNMLAGQELVYLASRWEAYVVTVQGSARLRLTDGRIYEVGYAGYNGYDYVSPGRQMIADGVITRDQLSLKGLSTYFAAHPDMEDKYLSMNPRYVFFTERVGGPFGCLNEPVTSFATIATDKDVYPRAMPAFLKVPVPVSTGAGTVMFNGFMMDQDAGGAIRAAGRTDIYMGIGPQAELLAGHQLNEGELYYVAVKPELVGQYLMPAAAQPATAPVMNKD